MTQYKDKISMGPDIENYYHIWKLEQNILTPKYDIDFTCSTSEMFHVTSVNDSKNSFKITSQHFNGYFKCTSTCGEIMYITLLHVGLTSPVI